MMLIRIDKKLKVCKITTFYKNRDNKDSQFVTVFPFFTIRITCENGEWWFLSRLKKSRTNIEHEIIL